jgi:hypothetical protein
LYLDAKCSSDQGQYQRIVDDEVYREQVRDGGNLIGNLARSSQIHMGLKPNEFIMIILNLSHGLAVTQKILGAELSPKGTRHLIHSLDIVLVIEISPETAGRGSMQGAPGDLCT